MTAREILDNHIGDDKEMVTIYVELSDVFEGRVDGFICGKPNKDKILTQLRDEVGKLRKTEADLVSNCDEHSSTCQQLLNEFNEALDKVKEMLR